MERKLIYLGDIDRALLFVQKAGTMDAIMKLVSGSKTVNAKSLLGVFSLNLKEPVYLEVSGDKSSRETAWSAMNDYLTS